MEKEPRLDNITVQSVVDTERVGYESTERPIIEEALGIKFYPGYLERHGLDPIFVNDELVHSAFPGISDVKLKSAIDLVHMMGTFLTGHTYSDELGDNHELRERVFKKWEVLYGVDFVEVLRHGNRMNRSVITHATGAVDLLGEFANATDNALLEAALAVASKEIWELLGVKATKYALAGTDERARNILSIEEKLHHILKSYFSE